jgi:hypothetical protein
MKPGMVSVFMRGARRRKCLKIGSTYLTCFCAGMCGKESDILTY